MPLGDRPGGWRARADPASLCYHVLQRFSSAVHGARTPEEHAYGDVPQHPFPHRSRLTAKEAIRRGIAPDGGLFVIRRARRAAHRLDGPRAERATSSSRARSWAPCCPTTPPTRSPRASMRHTGTRFASPEVTPWSARRASTVATARPPTCSSSGTAPPAPSRTSRCRCSPA